MSLAAGMVFNTAPLWLVGMIVMLAVEAAVPGLVSIWFAVGALAALFSSLFGAPIWLQLLWFAAVSVLCLWLTRPLVRKYVNSRVQPTNADALIGRDGVVTESIDNIQGLGAVKIRGQVWTARSADDSHGFSEGDIVRVRGIEGVKLIVEKK